MNILHFRKNRELALPASPLQPRLLQVLGTTAAAWGLAVPVVPSNDQACHGGAGGVVGKGNAGAPWQVLSRTAADPVLRPWIHQETTL